MHFSRIEDSASSHSESFGQRWDKVRSWHTPTVPKRTERWTQNLSPGMGGWELKSKDLRPGSRAILSQRMATIRRGTSVGLTNPKPHRNDRSHDHADDLSMNQDPSKQGTTAKPERCRPCQDPFPCAENYTRRTRGAHRAIENFLARKHFASVPPLRSATHTRVFGG